jgi:hypothetical protein
MFVEQFKWCDRHRSELKSMVETLCSEVASRDWTEMAADLERIYAADGGIAAQSQQ